MSENNTTKTSKENKKGVEKTVEKTESKKIDVEVTPKSVGKTETVEKKNSETTESPVKKKRKKVRRQVRRGRAYIKSSYNNTLVLFTDMHGNSLVWSSAGLLGFKGAKKATTYAANQVALDADEKVQKYGLKDIEVFVRGVGSGRDAALRALVQKGYNLLSIKDITPVPHNGCRPKKPRRV
jgi:small subunit ribosomal protein S11